jgi:hypothetical protein
MNEVINLNSDDLKRKIRKKIHDMEDIILFNDKNGNTNDLESYIFLLFFDTIPKNELFDIEKKRELVFEEKSNIGDVKIEKNILIKTDKLKNKEKIIQIMNDPEGYYEEWFDRIFQDNNNNEKSLIKTKILQVLRGKYMEIKKKEEECTKLIKQLEELYIQEELEKKVPLTNYKKKEFKIDSKTIFGNNTKFGEMFARYIFCQYFYENQKQMSLPIFFYEEDIFRDLMSVNQIELKSFSTWNPLLKYWFIYLFLINRFFSKETNLDDFLKTTKLFELARRIVEWKKDSESSSKKRKKDKKDKKKKKKRHSGGDPNTNIEIQQFKKMKGKNQLSNKKHGEKSEKKNSMKEINQIREFLRKTFFFKNGNVYNFNDYLNGDDRKNIVLKYYQSKVGDSKEIQVNQPFPLLFYPSIDITYKKFVKNDTLHFIRNHHQDSNVNVYTFLNAMKENITIFQTLFNYREENIGLFEPLNKNIRDSVMMYYFALFYKKKFIYTRYLQVFDRYLQKMGLQLNELVKNKKEDSNKNNNNNKNDNDNDNENENRNKREEKIIENRVVNITHLTPSNQQKYQMLLKKIELLKEKRKELEENKNQNNSNEKILVIEKYIRDLQLQKYQLL